MALSKGNDVPILFHQCTVKLSCTPTYSMYLGNLNIQITGGGKTRWGRGKGALSIVMLIILWGYFSEYIIKYSFLFNVVNIMHVLFAFSTFYFDFFSIF